MPYTYPQLINYARAATEERDRGEGTQMAQIFWNPGTAGDWSTASDWQSGVVPIAADDVVIDASNAVTVDGTAAANSLILNISTLTVSGSLTLGTSLTFTGYSDELILSGGTLSAQSIASPNPYSGYIDGYGTINAAVTGDIVIYATSGTLKLLGSIADDSASLTINPAATLELGEGTSSPVYFEGPSGTLRLDAPAAFTGSIFVYKGDAIDLAGVSASSASYSGTTLTINETNGQHLTYNVTGSISGTPTIAADGAGGTNVYWPLTVSWTPGMAGDWSTWANWSPEVVPTSIDDAVIDNSDAVTVNGTAVANSLTLDSSQLVVSGTLTISTSLTLDGDNTELTLSGGTLSAQSITIGTDGNFGVLSGYGTISAAISGDVDILANGGTLKVQGSLAGDTGYFGFSSNGATLELSNGTAEEVYFSAAFGITGDTLKLDAPTAFTGLMNGIVLGDKIDLVGINASSATYSGTTLTINETDGQQLTYNLIYSSVAGDILKVASDNNGGTDVYWTTPEPIIQSEVLSKNDHVKLTGITGAADDTISVYDGTTLLGATTTNSYGVWSFTTGPMSNSDHTFTVTAADLAGNVVQGSNEATLGSTHADTLVCTSGEIIICRGGNYTFVYNLTSDSTPSSHDTIKHFNASQDLIDFTNIAGINAINNIPTFQGRLTGQGNLTLNPHSVGYIDFGGNTEVLVNTTNAAEIVTHTNVGAANMEIILVGNHPGLTNADFYHV